MNEHAAELLAENANDLAEQFETHYIDSPYGILRVDGYILAYGRSHTDEPSLVPDLLRQRHDELGLSELAAGWSQTRRTWTVIYEEDGRDLWATFCIMTWAFALDNDLGNSALTAGFTCKRSSLAVQAFGKQA